MTLVEMLVVMLIVGILTAIAIPVMINQRSRAHDTGTRHDARQVGLAVRSWFMEHTASPAVVITSGRYRVAGTDAGGVTEGTVVAGSDPATVDTTGWTPTAWCLALTHRAGSTVRVSATNGLESGSCSSPTSP